MRRFVLRFLVCVLVLNCSHVYHNTNQSTFHALGRTLYQQPRNSSDLEVRIVLDSRFSEPQRLHILEAFSDFGEMHIRFVVVGTSDEADLIVKFWDNTNWKSKIVGYYREGTRVVYIASDRVYSLSGLRWVFMHETCHWLGMQHICRFPGESADCSNVRFGDAVMNPENDTDKEFAVSFTELDLLEFQRAVGSR